MDFNMRQISLLIHGWHFVMFVVHLTNSLQYNDLNHSGEMVLFLHDLDVSTTISQLPFSQFPSPPFSF